MLDLTTFTDPKNRPQLAMAGLRISTGVLFLLASWGKVTAEGGFGPRLVGFLNHQKDMPDWYRAVVDAVIIPNEALVGYLVAYGELFLGLALIVGAMTRPALILGLFMVANFMLAKGHAFWAASNHDSLYVLIFLALVFMKPGDFLGLDPWLKEKFPKLPL